MNRILQYLYYRMYSVFNPAVRIHILEFNDVHTTDEQPDNITTHTHTEEVTRLSRAECIQSIPNRTFHGTCV